MSKRQTPRDVQVMHRLSGARMIGVTGTTPATMAIDARPRVGEPIARAMRRPGPSAVFSDEEAPPMVEEIDDAER